MNDGGAATCSDGGSELSERCPKLEGIKLQLYKHLFFLLSSSAPKPTQCCYDSREIMRKDVENHWRLRQEVVAAVQQPVRVEAAEALA